MPAHCGAETYPKGKVELLQGDNQRTDMTICAFLFATHSSPRQENEWKAIDLSLDKAVRGRKKPSHLKIFF